MQTKNPIVRFVYLFSLSILSLSITAFGQEIPKNWFLLDMGADNYPGVSSEKAYEELLKNKKGQKVIVAILDSGVDFEHEDLKGIMWVNPGEIPGNGKDDDNNGYVDDVHGWNFIGGKDGKNVKEDTYEVTRVYAKYKKKFEGKTAEQVSGKEKKEYQLYLKCKEEVESNLAQAKKDYDNMMDRMSKITSALISLEKHMQGKAFTQEAIREIEPNGDEELSMGKSVALQAFAQGGEIKNSADLRNSVLNQFADVLSYYRTKTDIAYNHEYDTRHIVGDNYMDINERIYGNANAKGPDSFHGTHVGGIVAGNRTNNIGIKGIAKDALLMSVRCVPDGDERDKDVANAIRYAVDNGASIINMSFGKGYSWDKSAVDAAVKYAAKHDVLLVHAAGNSSLNIDIESNFPNARYEKAGLFKSKKAKNWIEVGALAPRTDEKAAARFSNYGKKTVDIFAPGVRIYSTIPESKYDFAQGTSMASPAVAGVAALIRSHYPALTAVQVKEAIMKTAVPITSKVTKPGTQDLVDFKELCVTGGYINAYKALEYASKMKGKKKVKA